MAIIKANHKHLSFIEFIVIILKNTIETTTLITQISFIYVANISVLVGSVIRDRKGMSVARWIKKNFEKSQSLLYRSNGTRLAIA